MRFIGFLPIVMIGTTLALSAQPTKLQPGTLPPKPAPPVLQTQAPSSVTVTKEADGSPVVEIRNVAFEVTGDLVPGNPNNARLLLRKTVLSKETFGDIGVDATITLDAWHFGDDPRQKPLYSISMSGTEAHTLDNAIFVASRGLEEVDWLSIYRLANGQHLFDTYVPLLSFSISRDTVTTRYVGLEVPPDDTKDARLKQPNVVAVLTYASADRVIREALLTCDDPKEAALLRSFADMTRMVSLVEAPASGPAATKSKEPTRALRVAFSQNYPSQPDTKEVTVPLAGDDLDLAKAQLPAKVHVAAWKR